MSDLISRAADIYRNHGPLGIMRGAVRWLFWRGRRLADPLYQIVKPSVESFSVGASTSRFDMTEASLYRHDFRADLDSERDVIMRVLSEIHPDDVFFDIGANVGIYSLFVGDTIENGEVVAFEPHPERAAMFERNAELNDLEVDLKRVALSNETGEMDLVTDGTTRHRLASGDVNGGTSVNVVPGDDLVSRGEIPVPNVIKLDVEGGEMDALRGLEQTIVDGGVRAVFCEVHPDLLRERGEDPDGPRNFLSERGFEVERLEDRKNNYFLFASRGT